jgi:DNA-binding LacI/PurR family transcriptional regulator
MGILKAAKELGVLVPRDILVIGLGNIPFAFMKDPPLTTVREPSQDMGYQAADMLFEIIAGRKFRRKNITLPVE